MDSDIIRRNKSAELNAQFELKLREARRQASQAEAEMETASERWRAERRRLNDEIDALEAALAAVKTSKPIPSPEKKEAAAAVAETVRVQSAADASSELLRKSAAEWTAERGKLLSEIARLERTVTDILERSNNPMRSAQLVNERLETQINETDEAKKNIAKEYARAKAAWDEERMKMAGELFRLRRWAGPATQERNDSEELRRARAEIEQLERKLAETRDHVNADVVEQLRQQYTSKLQEIAVEKTRLAEDLHNATAMLDRERQRFAAAPAGLDADKDVGSADIDAEIARVQQAIAEIERLMEDPATELAAVIRKNVERSSLDSYLKGILFALGQRQGA